MFRLVDRPDVRACAVAVIFACVWPTLSPRAVAASPPLSEEGMWTRVILEDPFARMAVLSSLTAASEWLAKPGCQSLAVEFRDGRDLPLANRLAELGTDWNTYMSWILFRNGSGRVQCDAQTLAYTTPGGRVVFVCERQFERAWNLDPRRATAIIIHEVLHTLGLQENPPSSDEITSRVLARCKPLSWRRDAQHLR
jgi:hypothetical protein